MGQPKEKQSKQRSHCKRRGANRFKAPLLVKEADGSFFPVLIASILETGQYRGKQVLDIEV